MRNLLGVVLALGLASVGLSACGGSTDSDSSAGGGSTTGGSGGASSGGGGGATGGSGGAATGGSGNAAGTGGIDCSNVGCAAPPMCATGCTAVCGCCPCADGEQQPAQGGYMLCTGGCWTLVAAKSCGGLGGATCAADEWCDLPNGCGFPDATGVCKKRPQGCTADCPGVCGCDGKLYCNTCGANAMGADTGSDLSCMVGKPCQNDSECATGLKCCYPCGIPGCDNKCMQPMPNGMCPMFP